MQRLIKRLLKWLVLAGLGGLLALGGFNLWLVQRSAARVTDRPDRVPSAPLALVLGTSQYLENGAINPHWRGRMDAAAALWKAGRVRHFLVSGDNRKANYNEPRDMRDGLVARGVPAAAVSMDYAGLRTLDSVIRAHEIFGVKKCVIVTDDFHLPRALWLADRRGMEVTGFHGPALPWRISKRARTREWPARFNAALEEWILGTGAQHYGEREILPVPPEDGTAARAAQTSSTAGKRSRAHGAADQSGGDRGMEN